jgi:hypothetical protein
MRRLLPGILLFAFMTSIAGCNKNDQTTVTPTTPTTTTTTATVTETFAGTLKLNGGITFPFTATAGGTITATLTSVAPDSTTQIGLSLGSWTGAACQIVIANDAAAQTAVVTGTLTSPASLCVRVYDPSSKIATPVDFSVSIVHP